MSNSQCLLCCSVASTSRYHEQRAEWGGWMILAWPLFPCRKIQKSRSVWLQWFRSGCMIPLHFQAFNRVALNSRRLRASSSDWGIYSNLSALEIREKPPAQKCHRFPDRLQADLPTASDLSDKKGQWRFRNGIQGWNSVSSFFTWDWRYNEKSCHSLTCTNTLAAISASPADFPETVFS